MATSLLSHLSAPPSPTIDNYQGRQAGAFNSGIPNTFLHGTKVFSATPSSSRRLAAQRRFKSAYAKASEHIPKQFRQENLKDGRESSLPCCSLCLFIDFHGYPSLLV